MEKKDVKKEFKSLGKLPEGYREKIAAFNARLASGEVDIPEQSLEEFARPVPIFEFKW